MAAVGVKRKLIVDKSPTHHLLHSPPSPIALLRRRGLPSDLESSEGTVVGEGSGYAAEAERAGAGDDEDGADDDGEGVGDNKGGQGGHGKGGDGDGDDGNGGAAGYGGSGYGGALYGGVPGSYDLSGYAMF
uniref:Uncharacterized protein n=1 Tax=Oryza barthii TaxID=65489 RepID=A0A0D3FTJ1_9ORYZ